MIQVRTRTSIIQVYTPISPSTYLSCSPSLDIKSTRDAAPEPVTVIQCALTQIAVYFSGHGECIDNHFGGEKRNAGVTTEIVPSCTCSPGDFRVWSQLSCGCVRGPKVHLDAPWRCLLPDYIHCLDDYCECYAQKDRYPRERPPITPKTIEAMRCSEHQSLKQERNTHWCEGINGDKSVPFLDSAVPEIQPRDVLRCPEHTRLRHGDDGHSWCQGIRDGGRKRATTLDSASYLQREAFCQKRICPGKLRPYFQPFDPIHGDCTCR